MKHHWIGVSALLAAAALAGCGSEESPGPEALGGAVPARGAQDPASPGTQGLEPAAPEQGAEDAGEFTPPPDWCGTGRLPAGLPLPTPPVPFPPFPPTPPAPGGTPLGAGGEEPYPPSNWCGTGRVGLGAGAGWQGPDDRGRWQRRVLRLTAEGWVVVILSGEDRDGRFVTWEEEEPAPPRGPLAEPGRIRVKIK